MKGDSNEILSRSRYWGFQRQAYACAHGRGQNGIGVEAYTVGSAEFTLSFAATHDGCMPLMDNGHYHPTEVVSDKIPAMLCFYPQ